MNTPILRALSASIWAAGLLTAPMVGAQTAVTKGVASSNVAAAPLSGPMSTNFAVVGKPMNLFVGKSTLLRVPSAVTRISVGSPEVADVTLISPTELYVLGKRPGDTNLLIWVKGSGVTAVDVVVKPSEQFLVDLKGTLARLFPIEKGIDVSWAGGSIVLKGLVTSAVKAKMVEDVTKAYVRELNKAWAVSTGDGAGGSGTSVSISGAGGKTETAGIAGSQVINLLSVAEAQQVMLEVTVAEVSKTLLDKMGANLSLTRTLGNWTYGIGSAFGGDGRGLLDAIKNTNGTGVNIDAEKSDGLVKILAEPNLVAISGQEASFLAGGKIFIPVARENNVSGGTTITLEEKEFGVGVKFTPTVLEGGRIHLKVAPEVSELSQTGTPFTTVNGSTAILPSFTTRRAQTTVQLMDGQSLAIAGLIKNNTRQALDALPGLGEVPVLGALFRSNEFQGDRTELMFVITPRLIKPLDPGYILPTDGYKPPSRPELYFGNQLEGTGRADVPSDRPAATPPAPVTGTGGMELK